MTSPRTASSYHKPIDPNTLEHQTAKEVERRALVADLWLKGYTQEEIGVKLVHSTATVNHDIKVIRAELRVIYQGDLEDKSNFAVEKMRRLSVYGWELLADEKIAPGQKAGIMAVIVRSEEMQAKLQGLLLSDRHIDMAAIMAKMPMYSFTDHTPPALGSHENPIEAEFKEVVVNKKEATPN